MSSSPLSYLTLDWSRSKLCSKFETGGRPGRGGSKETSLLYYLQIQPNPGQFKLRRMVDSPWSHAQTIPVINAPCALLIQLVERRVDGVVGYRICLTSVHRRSSVRAWVDSLFLHPAINVFIRATYNWRCYIFRVLHRSQHRESLHFSLFWCNTGKGEPSRYSQRQQTHWSRREGLLESRQGILLLMTWWILFLLTNIRPSGCRGISASYLCYIELYRPRWNRHQSRTKCVGPSLSRKLQADSIISL